MKKILATILTIITALCFAVGIAGCKGCGDKGNQETDENTIICKIDFGKPTKAHVMQALYYSQIDRVKGVRLNKLYSYFKSVEYSYIEELSDDDDFFHSFYVEFYFKENERISVETIKNGKSLIRYSGKYYVSEEGAVDYEKLMEYYNANIKYTTK